MVDPNNPNPQNPVVADPQIAPNPAIAPNLGQPSVAPQQPPVPNVPVQPPVPQVQKIDGGQGSSSKVMFVLVGVVILLVIFGGVYFYITRSQTTQETPQQAQQIDTSELEELQNEANQVDLGDVESDFRGVDSDLQSL